MRLLTVGFVWLISCAALAQDPWQTDFTRRPNRAVDPTLAVSTRVRDTLCIIGTGDIMLGTNYPSITYLPPGEDCSPLLAPVHHVLQSGDLLFGNLEGVFAGGGGYPEGLQGYHQLLCIPHARPLRLVPGGGGLRCHERGQQPCE